MIKTILQHKYDIESFSFDRDFIVTLSSASSSKRLSFGDRVVYTRFYEEELANKNNFSYYNLLGKATGATTLIQDIDSELLKKIEEQSGGIYSAEELKHYIIIAENHVMDIVSFDEAQEIK